MATITVQPLVHRGRMQVQKRKNLDAWVAFFRRCWQVCLDYQQFEKRARRMMHTAPLNEEEIFEAWSRQVAVQQWVSNRMLLYLDILYKQNLLDDISILSAIKKRLAKLFEGGETLGPNSVQKSPEVGALDRMTSKIVQRLSAKDAKKVVPQLRLSMRLFELIGAFIGTAEGGGGVVTDVVLKLGESLASYLAAHVNDLAMAGVLTASKGGPPELLRKAFSKVVPSFITILTASGSHLAQNLVLLQEQSKLQEGIVIPAQEDSVDAVDAMNFQQSVPDTPVALSPASLYVYLTAMLTGTPEVDDFGLKTFLAARYGGDVQSLITDLIAASFDILAGVMDRKEQMEVIVIHRSFIANKLPALIEEQSAFLPASVTTEDCIRKAMKLVEERYKNTNVISPGSDTCPRQRFLLACAVFSLLPETSIPAIMGNAPTQSPVTRYAKEKLVQQCQADSKRIAELVNELEKMEGNASSIARALLEIIYTLCSNRDTMTLKTICNAFMKKPHTINVMLLFAEARLLLQPLCTLLDTWQSQDDQGEHQPVYEEFGSILLFLLLCQHRYNLPLSTFAAALSDSFVVSMFNGSFLPKLPQELTDPERENLGGWIKGLFEEVSISDDLMSRCSPKDFWMITPTMTDQILIACQTGVLGIDNVKSGAEFLLEPFLLPSLVLVLNLFSNCLWSISAEAPQLDFLMPILMLVVKPPKLSPDADPLHRAVLSIVGSQLSRALAHVRNLHRRRQDVNQLIEALRQHTHAPLSAAVPRQQLESWCTTSGGALSAALRNSLDNLAKWSSLARVMPDRQPYNHRLTMTAIHDLGAPATLSTLLEHAAKTTTSTSTGTGTAAAKSSDAWLDTLTGLIAASELKYASSGGGGCGRMTLKEALQAQQADAYAASRTSPARAHFIVRLARRVDAHTARPVGQPDPILPIAAAAGLVGEGEAVDAAEAAAVAAAAAAVGVGVGDLDAAAVAALAAGDPSAAAAAAAAAGAVPVDTTGLQADLGDTSMDMGDAQGDMGYSDFMSDFDLLQGQSVDDIFANM